jgi:hypothetical protein
MLKKVREMEDALNIKTKERLNLNELPDNPVERAKYIRKYLISLRDTAYLMGVKTK